MVLSRVALVTYNWVTVIGTYCISNDYGGI